MTVKIGLVGLGFMGTMHLSKYVKLDSAEVVAVCDQDKRKLDLRNLSTEGNIEISSFEEIDLPRIKKFSNYGDLIENSDVRLVDICLPTNIHSKVSIAALNEDKHVLVEKPIAGNLSEAEDILQAVDRSEGKFMVGQCIRFWPEYQYVKREIEKGEFGEVITADFRRLSPLPDWTWNSWILDSKKSKGAILDLHIHDTDFVNYLFGLPESVFSRGAFGPTKGLDYVMTTYTYIDGPSVVTAQGGWSFPSNFPFNMSFTILCKKGTIHFDSLSDPTLTIYTNKGETYQPEVEKVDGWFKELEYFLSCIEDDKEPEIASGTEAFNSLKVVLKEIESCKKGELVKV